MEIQETKQSPFNTTPRRLACSLPGSRVSQSSANYDAVALQFPQFAQLSAVQWVQSVWKNFLEFMLQSPVSFVCNHQHHRQNLKPLRSDTNSQLLLTSIFYLQSYIQSNL